MPAVSTIHRQGDLVHPELVCADLAGDCDFYAQLFGWEYTPGVVGPHYIATIGGMDCAGLAHTVTRADKVPTGWGPYLAVDDPDHVCKIIVECGGNVAMAPRNIGEFGRIAFAADPFGAVFDLWRGGPVPGTHVIGEPGTICMAELITPDIEKSKIFYSTIFGLEFAHHSAGDTSGFGTVDTNGLQLVISPRTTESARDRNRWLVYLGVTDVAITIARAVELGGVLVRPESTVHGQRTALLGDPHGATVGIVELAAQT
ncbi:VOC family protein [Nocardia sp. NPDC052566]|uniref:VOC family protein n=1 Tax=Nocardia sp. NPDC052566 TaxID=3364330 RepID=UPI0037CB0605